MDRFLRKYITPISVVVFAAVSVTGLMLVFGLHGRPLKHMHETFGFLFIAAGILHVVRNRHAFVLTMRQGSAKMLVAILCALALVLIVSAVLAPGRGFQGGHGYGHGRAYSQLTLQPATFL